MGVGKLAFRMFGRLFRGKEHARLKSNLRKARMTASPEIYKASSLFYSLFVGIAGGVVGFLVGVLLGLPFPLAIAPILMLGILFSALSYQLFVSYPGMVAGERERLMQQYPMPPPTCMPSVAAE
ncbi:hypothetical protein AKJ42_00755 [candidate division MSBL1 archaeon SCGC-AAA261C02]|uniref:Type II secretion system protein GspF domain-containing protein n=1 Tax=candidate division MSBL1 archaeon SCGC-AAA261C02 TaxID=1698272 RepID=A0A133V1Z5_9EURY|nr:hypothetical protein AKJ42_00755 [candidate division MSBL1 archaeon SCGC-AAA261C02]